MKVLVLGAAGWVGRAVLANLEGMHEIRAFDSGPEAWEQSAEIDGEWTQGEIVHGDISDFATVESALDGIDRVIHLAVLGGEYGDGDALPFTINLKGLWNVLEICDRKGIARVVHVGSAQIRHPEGIFFGPEVRRPDASLYAVTKRLQEEMCRQFHEGKGLSIIVLRPCSIVDARLGINKGGTPMTGFSESWVCRHDLAEGCRLALETDSVQFDVFHAAGTPEAAATCDVDRARGLLGWEYRADLRRFAS